jgi:hypothetical protein
MKQTIMLGFSDGTKDGYLMANWSIYKLKRSLLHFKKIWCKSDLLMVVVDHQLVVVVKRTSFAL